MVTLIDKCPDRNHIELWCLADALKLWSNSAKSEYFANKHPEISESD